MTSNSALDKYLKIVLFTLLIVFLFLTFFQPIETGDSWGHLSLGRWIVQEGQFPQVDPFSYGNEGVRWKASQWLGELIFYMMYRLGGIQGLKLFRAVFFLLVFAIFFRHVTHATVPPSLKHNEVAGTGGVGVRAWGSTKKIPLSLLSLLLFIMAIGLKDLCLLRPLIFNFIFIQIFLIHLFDYQNHQNTKRLMMLPIFGVFWVNIHLGSFFYGMVLIAIFLFAQIIQYFNSKRDNESSSKEVPQVKPIKDLGLTLLIYALIFLINPYGLDGFLHPYQVLLFPSFINFYQFNASIAEMHPPAYIFTSSGLWAVLLMIFGLLAILRHKKNQFVHLLLFCCALFFFFYGGRGRAFFIIINAYLIGQWANHVDFSGVLLRNKYLQLLDRTLKPMMILLLAGHVISMVNAKVFTHDRFIRALSMKQPAKSPLSSIEFLQRHNIEGGVINEDTFGGLLLWKGYPKLKPLVDGRQANQDVFATYVQILKHPKKYWPVAEKEFGLTIALLTSDDFSLKRLIKYLHDLPDWQLVHIDGPNMVFVKRGAYSLPDSVNQLESRLGAVPLLKEDIQWLETIKSKADQRTSHRSLRQLFDPPPVYVDSLEEGITLFELGYHGASLKQFIKALEFTDRESTQEIISVIITELEKVDFNI